MNCFDEYRAKLCTAEEAVKLVKSGDWVDYSSNACFPASLDAALALRRDELRNVKIRGHLIPGPVAAVECDESMEHFVYSTWHCSVMKGGCAIAGGPFSVPCCFAIWAGTIKIS